jgi:hypothetical protein
VKGSLHYDYTAVGHVTIDVLEDGTRRPGGTALYSALQAARLGLRALILTQGAPAEIEALLAPFGAELDLRVVAAPETTTLRSSGTGAERRQRLEAWAGAMPDGLELDTAILHLAPIARETPRRWLGEPRLLGMTPQGLARAWASQGAAVELGPPVGEAEELARACNALVLSEHERASCAVMIAATRAAGGVVAVTNGPAPTTVLLGAGRSISLEVPAVVEPLDDLGAGDVYAAAFFIALSDGRQPEDAARFAMAAAAVRMLGAGPQAIGDHTAIAARLAAVGAPAA